MKTELRFTKQRSYTFYTLLVFCLCFNYGWSQNLLLNSTMDEFSNETNDNIEVSGIAIHDILGKNVLSQNGLSNNTINVSALNTGVYFLKINANEKTITKKIIIE